jgi:hypothetical protein
MVCCKCQLAEKCLSLPTAKEYSYIRQPLVRIRISAAIAESSDGGANTAVDYVLILADCHHAIELEFSLVNSKEQEESLAKIDTLTEVINRFREALHTEAKAKLNSTTHDS